MKRIAKEKSKKKIELSTKSQEQPREESTSKAQCCAKVSKIVAGCHD